MMCRTANGDMAVTTRMTVTEAMEELFRRDERDVPRWLAHDWLVFVGFSPQEAAGLLNDIDYGL